METIDHQTFKHQPNKYTGHNVTIKDKTYVTQQTYFLSKRANKELTKQLIKEPIIHT